MGRLLRLAFIVFILFFQSCKQEKRYHDSEQPKHQSVANDGIRSILEFQKRMNEEFRDPQRSPLSDTYRKHFVSLDFFEPDTNYIVTAKLVRTPDALPFLMPTNTDRMEEEKVYGVAHFNLNGKAHRVEVYQNLEMLRKEGFVDRLFLPFTDLTNGTETYAGGRYIDLSIPQGEEMIIDFNKAYNPYCAYNKKYSCPLVPPVNALGTEVRAGVKDFQKANEGNGY
ncbi:MAG: DUF1684 domain-containing protein [Flavobacteriaceae bacterium]